MYRFGVTKSRVVRRVFARGAFAVLVAVMCLQANCPEDFTPVTRLAYIDVTSSHARAQPGDRITIEWDFQNVGLLVSQGVRFLSPFLQGFQQPPPDFTMDNGTRTLSFDFTGPVTVVLHATDQESDAVNPTISEINIAFDIALDEEFFVVARGVGTAHPKFPRLGFPLTGFDLNGDPIFDLNQNGVISRDINFSQFVAMYDLPTGETQSRDGLIAELLLTPGLTNVLSPVLEFRAGNPVMPAKENVGMEGGGLGFEFDQGMRFPLLSQFLADFLGIDVQPSNALLFAGAISYSGTAAIVKADGDDLPAFTNAIDFEPIFLSIDMQENNGVLLVSDIHLGNLRQGLMVTAEQPLDGIDDNTDQRRTGQQDIAPFERAFLGAVGRVSGNVKGALLGVQVEPLVDPVPVTVFNGVDVDGSYIFIDTVEFVVPYHPDTDLGDRIPNNVVGVNGLVAP